MNEWTAARLAMERGWIAELGLGLRRLRPASGEPRATLLYVHGLGESGLTFETMVCDPQLVGFDHVIVDLPGYGRSAWPAAALDLLGHARVVARLIRRLELPRVVLVGHSMGGVIGLYVAEDSPELLRGFLNIEGNVTLDDCTYSRRASSISPDDWLGGGWRHFVEELHQEACDSSGERPHVLRAYGASVQFADPRTLLQNSCDLVNVSNRDVVAERLGALQVPHLYVHGSRSSGIRSLGRLRDAGVELCKIEDAGHWPFVDHPDVTAGVVRDFAAECLPSR